MSSRKIYGARDSCFFCGEPLNDEDVDCPSCGLADPPRVVGGAPRNRSQDSPESDIHMSSPDELKNPPAGLKRVGAAFASRQMMSAPSSSRRSPSSPGDGSRRGDEEFLVPVSWELRIVVGLWECALLYRKNWILGRPRKEVLV